MKKIIKYKLLITILFWALSAHAIDFNKGYLTRAEISQISAAIYKIEGGNKTQYPFGIRSINTHHDYNKAKIICENTIKNNFARWNKTNKSIDFLTFLGNVYCPRKSDKQGNINWIKNIHLMVK